MSTISTISTISTPNMPREMFTCPITQMPFKHPVLAQDGHFYEKSAIEKWQLQSKMSPITSQLMDVFLTKSFVFDAILADFYEKNPDEILNRFDDRKMHKDYECEVANIIRSKKFDQLKQYMEFDLKIFGRNTKSDEDLVADLVDRDDGASDEILKYFVDNIIDINSNNYGGKHLLHIMAGNASDIIIFDCMSRDGIDLNIRDNNGFTFSHAICKYGTSSMVKYILDNNIGLKDKTNNGKDCFYLICKHESFEIISYALDKKFISYINETYSKKNDTYGLEGVIISNNRINKSSKILLINKIIELKSILLLEKEKN